MPSLTPFKIFMERKKPKSGGRTDEFVHVKAAAWAWYQHGSGSEGKPVCEVLDVSRTRQAPARPSRYRLEAMRSTGKEGSMDGSETPFPIRKDDSLLDNYEVESISKHLDYLIQSSSKRFYGVEIFDRDDLLHHRKSISLLDSDRTCGMKQQKSKKKFLLLGFWRRHSVLCGSREDVNTGALVRCGSGSSSGRKGIFR
ncbi:hypothetical protein OIU79_002279 [Salix purpurea]|uniref:Uncharacterized protein n=1 Tax=Salix purpurea TaxID=77065 RepID=A0A9Q0ZHY8_SALPP|nr:hypothetical protein OIU79_002279 [Salix purpurea]